MNIIPLSEGSFTIDQSKLFIPFDQEADALQERSRGSLLVEIQPFAVVTAKDVLLLDTGLGFSKNGRLQLYRNLEQAGIEPASVTKVLMSHLHKDHAGGTGVDTEDGERKPAFPGATYYIQQAEWDYAFEKGFPSYIPDELACLKEKARVEWLQGDGFIDGYIEYRITGAHSPWHQVFFIREGEEIVFFGGDEAPQLHQMKHRFAAKYDYDGKKAMQLRQQWWEEGQRENWTFLFYHDIKWPVVHAGRV